MELNYYKKRNRQFNFLIWMWIIPLILIELVLSLNIFSSKERNNLHVVILAMIFSAFVFIPGIIFNIWQKKKQLNVDEKKKSICFVLFQLALICSAFVGLMEAGFDSKTTVKQVNEVITMVKGEVKKIYLESIEVENKTLKEKYEIGDIINIDFKYSPSNATEKALLYEVDNEIVSIDMYNKQIKCLKNGTCNITFYDSANKDVKYTVNITIDSLVLEEIFLEEKKDIFLDLNESYELNPKLIPEGVKDVELHYTSSNEKIAIVDGNGIIKAVSPGTATIKCYYEDVYEEVYVTVCPIMEMNATVEKVNVYYGDQNRKIIKLNVDDIRGYTTKYVRYEYPEDANIKVTNGGYSVPESYISIGITNNEESLTESKVFDLKIIYGYPGGYEVYDIIEVTLKVNDDLLVSDINLSSTKTNVNATLYFDNDKLITNYITSTIAFKTTSYKDLFNFKYESEDGVSFDGSTYKLMVMSFNDSNIKDKYIVKYYPSTSYEEYIEITVNIKKKQISSYDTSFELTRLYNSSEGKNEIWYKYATIDLFNNVSFVNSEFKNSGLYIKPTSETLELIDINISKYGVVEKMTFKNVNAMNIPYECVLEFDVCSYLEYEKNNDCEKYRYIIEVKKEYDYFGVRINDGELITEENIVTIKKGETFPLKFETFRDLEYKGDFQKNISNNIVNGSIENTKVLNFTFGSITGVDYGETTLTLYMADRYVENKKPFTITVRVVDENGEIPTNKILTVEAVYYDEECPPIPEKKIYSTTTKLQFSIEEIEKFEFISSDPSIASVDDNGLAVCLKPGKVKITAKNKTNYEVYSYSFTIFENVHPFEVIKGDFVDITAKENYFVITVKVNTLYQFKFADNYSQTYTFTKSKLDTMQYFELGENGSVLITKTGNYTCKVQAGENNSPYKKTVTYVFVCNSTGVTSQFTTFIRKAVGHFGLFMAIGICAVISLLMYNGFGIKNKYIPLIFIIVFGPYIAFTTEYIQEIDPTRTCSVKDMLIDSWGFFTGVIVMIIIMFLFKHKKKKEELNNE